MKRMRKPSLSSILLAQLILGLVPFSTPVIAGDSAWQKQVAAFWESQYQSIERGIKDGPRHEPGKNPYMLDEQALILTTDRDPVDVQLRRTRALLAHLDVTLRVNGLVPLAAEVSKIAAEADSARAASQTAKLHELYCRLREITRKASLSNPLLDFNDLLVMGYVRTRRGRAHGGPICRLECQTGRWHLHPARL